MTAKVIEPSHQWNQLRKHPPINTKLNLWLPTRISPKSCFRRFRPRVFTYTEFHGPLF